uniref:Major facilitator superfamily (MFS) profile domain-containing protein n=1 Tax=Eutreptiella gymnastica TaxID=73025 RepID=A0A7S1NBD5_9EUGL|mmetsp:Transcript_150088/g.262113  ORF Transcript_150088/g.262113 Transcript_150088/m.262113 type:complete len:484 (+) Transcript_150088:205-1656(+)
MESTTMSGHSGVSQSGRAGAHAPADNLAADPPRPPQPPQPTTYWTAVRAMVVTCWPLILGNVLEWYEFSTYGYLVPELRDNFYAGSSVLAWLGFAVTFVGRPLGGAIIGWISDRYGRRRAIMLSLGGMLVATVGQGCLPSALTSPPWLANIGVVLLAVFRLVQGLCSGGEISGVSVSLAEFSAQGCLGMAISLISVGGSLAFFLSSGITALLHVLLTRDQMLLWGWRVPFLLTIIPGLFALQQRARLLETEAFTEAAAHRPPTWGCLHFFSTLRSVLCQHTAATVLGVLGTAGIATLWYVGPIYTADFMVQYCGLPNTTALTIASLAQVGSIVLSPLVGWLTDTIGVGKVTLLGALACALCGLPVYHSILTSDGDTAVVGFVDVVIIFGAVQALAGSTIYLWVLELYDTPIRTTGMGLSYNLAVSYLGGCGPMIADHLAQSTPYAPGALISAMGLVSTLALLYSRHLRKTGRLKCTHIRHLPY